MPDEGLEAVTTEFLEGTRRTALGHFSASHFRARKCHTMQRAIPLQQTGGGCNGTIVAHISTPLFAAWAAQALGSTAQRHAHVAEQIQLVLQDLADHDIHGYLALTEAQGRLYRQDLDQLVAESLNRTTFAALHRGTAIHWEGTLVRSLQPPILVLVLSIGLWDASKAGEHVSRPP